MEINIQSKIQERRKKRLITPAFYFFAEMVFIWLVLSLIQLDFNIVRWEVWSYIVLVLFVVYAFVKMLHVYQRQKDYKK